MEINLIREKHKFPAGSLPGPELRPNADKGGLAPVGQNQLRLVEFASLIEDNACKDTHTRVSSHIHMLEESRN